MIYLHHIILHFPIAFGMTALLFASLSFVMPGFRWREQASVMLILGALSALAASFTGFMAADVVIKGGMAESRITLHRLTAVIATTAYVIAAVWAFLQLNATAAQATPRGMLVASFTVALLVGVAAHNGGDMLHPNLSPLRVASQLADYLESRHQVIALWGFDMRPLLWPWHAISAGAAGVAFLGSMFFARVKKPARSWLRIHKGMNIGAIAAMGLGSAWGVFMVAKQAEFHFRVFHSFSGLVTLVLAGLAAAMGYEIFRTLTTREDRPVLRALHRWAGRAAIVLAFVSIFSGLLRTTLLGP